MTVDLEQQIAAAARELRIRESVYPKWIAAGKMKPESAAHEIAAMEAIVETLKALRQPTVTLTTETMSQEPSGSVAEPVIDKPPCIYRSGCDTPIYCASVRRCTARDALPRSARDALPR